MKTVPWAVSLDPRVSTIVRESAQSTPVKAIISLISRAPSFLEEVVGSWIVAQKGPMALMAKK